MELRKVRPALQEGLAANLAFGAKVRRGTRRSTYPIVCASRLEYDQPNNTCYHTYHPHRPHPLPLFTKSVRNVLQRKDESQP